GRVCGPGSLSRSRRRVQYRAPNSPARQNGCAPPRDFEFKMGTFPRARHLVLQEMRRSLNHRGQPRERKMAAETTLSGPDLSQGVAAATLVEGVPLLGHVGDQSVLVVRRGAD